MRLFLLLLLVSIAACGQGVDRPVVVVGFRADPSFPVPGMVMTSPNGKSWSPPVPIGEGGEWLTEVVAQGERFVAIGLSGGLYESDATGTRWSRRRVHTSWLDAIHFPRAAPGVGFLSGADAWWRTEDGGATWNELPPPGFYFEDFAFSSSATGVAVEGYLIPPSGKVWRTDDGGRGWSAAAQTASGLRAVASAGPGESELWAAGDDGLVLASTNGGVSWIDVSGPSRIGPIPDFTDVDFAADFTGQGAGWMVGSRGEARAYRGSEHPVAHRWTDGTAGDFVLQGVLARGRDEAYATGYRSFTDRGVVVHTRDGGRTWRVVVETPGIFWYSIAGQ